MIYMNTHDHVFWIKMFNEFMAKMLLVYSSCFTSSMYSLWERKGADSIMVFLHVRPSRAVYVHCFCVVSQCVGLYYCIQKKLYCVTVRYRVEHNHYLALMVDVGFSLQQSLDYFGVSMISSCLQSNIAILYKRQENSHC